MFAQTQSLMIIGISCISTLPNNRRSLLLRAFLGEHVRSATVHDSSLRFIPKPAFLHLCLSGGFASFMITFGARTHHFSIETVPSIISGCLNRFFFTRACFLAFTYYRGTMHEG